MIYLDASAIVKLVIAEDESEALHALLVADDTPPVRSLDAVHIATALSAGAWLRAVVMYDARMAASAAELGITVLAPNPNDDGMPPA